jgi:hypothetical protein
MIHVLTSDGELHTHEGAAVIAQSRYCPGDPCTGTYPTGFCVILGSAGTVTCLNSYPTGSSYSDCSCTEAPCPHGQLLEDSRQPVDDEAATAAARERIRHKALTAGGA